MLELRGEPQMAAAPRSSGDRKPQRPVRLENLVREQILPRLMRSHAPSVGRGLPVEMFARALLGTNEAHARASFDRIADICDDERRLLCEVIAPAARRLGDWWRDDECDFFAVAEGVARLQRILAGLAAPDAGGARAPAMLMLTPPGETHRFGADMAADLFRREGWRVLRADGDLTRLRLEPFDAISVSCGCERAAANLAKFLAEIKALAGLRPPPVLLGGALFEGKTAQAENWEADFVASDPDSPRRISRVLLQPRPV